MNFGKRLRPLAAGVAVISLLAAGCGSSSRTAGGGSSPSTASGSAAGKLSASAPGITPTTITIGMIADNTGPAGVPAFAQGAKDRVAYQNAHGGIDGRQLKLVVEDDETNPTDASAAAQLLAQRPVFGVVSTSDVLYTAAPFLTHKNIPVTGFGFDGPEWGTSSNMFAYALPTLSDYNGKSYQYNTEDKFFRQIGMTKLANLSYGIPSAEKNAKFIAQMGSPLGIQICYANYSVPFGAADFTAEVLQIKQAGCNGVVAAFAEPTAIALAKAIRNAGLNIKQYYFTTGTPSIFADPTVSQALQGTYTSGIPNHGSGPQWQAVVQFENQLQSVDPTYKGGVPDGNLMNGWDSVDVMIEGLRVAGLNPTRQSFEQSLRTDSSYTMGGLFPTPVDFNYLSGNFPAQVCQQGGFVQVTNNQFVDVPAGGGTICGQKVTFKA